MTIVHSDDMTAERMRANYRAWLQAGLWLAVIVVAMIGLFWEAASGAVSVWRGSETFNHCFLIPLIVGYLLWDRRAVFAAISPRSDPLLLLILPLPALVWLVGDIAAVLEVQQFAGIAMLQVVIATIIGRAAYRALLFPCLYLFLMVPSGEWLTAPLQDFTTWFIVRGLEILSIPVFNDGVFLEISNGRFEVAEACAGLRFLIAAVAFGFLFANLIYRSWRRRLVFIVLSFVVPIIANGFRALGIVLLAHYSDNRIAVGVDHIVYGWGFFTAILLALIWGGLRFREDLRGSGAPGSGIVADGAQAGTVGGLAITALITIAALSVAPAYATFLHDRGASGDAQTMAAPSVAAPWIAQPWRSSWRPIYVGASAEYRSAYGNTQDWVELLVAVYTDQSQGRKLVGFDNQLEDGDVWRRITDEPSQLDIGGTRRPAQVRRLIGPEGQRYIWRLYWIDGHWTSSGIEARARYVLGKLLRGRSRAAAVIVSTAASSPAEAAQVVQRFVDAMPDIAGWLRDGPGER